MKALTGGANKLGLKLTPEQVGQFRVYYEELVEWNRRMNLTRITDYEEVQVKHFLDALTVTLVMNPPSQSKGLSIIDVGSGAGIPGIPLKVVLPETRLVLLEATAKKARFLSHIVGRLGLGNVEVVVGRAEEVAHDVRYRERFDMALSRAVASLPTLVELTLPFCAVGGIFVAQKKGSIEQEIDRASRAMTLLGGNLKEARAVELEELSDERRLIVIEKVKPTPEEYPRRSGVPAKRPITS